jgi:hypothetical protein
MFIRWVGRDLSPRLLGLSAPDDIEFGAVGNTRIEVPKENQTPEAYIVPQISTLPEVESNSRHRDGKPATKST